MILIAAIDSIFMCLLACEITFDAILVSKCNSPLKCALNDEFGSVMVCEISMLLLPHNPTACVFCSSFLFFCVLNCSLHMMLCKSTDENGCVVNVLINLNLIAQTI